MNEESFNAWKFVVCVFESQTQNSCQEKAHLLMSVLQSVFHEIRELLLLLVHNLVEMVEGGFAVSRRLGNWTQGGIFQNWPHRTSHQLQTLNLFPKRSAWTQLSWLIDPLRLKGNLQIVLLISFNNVHTIHIWSVGSHEISISCSYQIIKCWARITTVPLGKIPRYNFL